jgi:hypothetical protein
MVRTERGFADRQRAPIKWLGFLIFALRTAELREFIKLLSNFLVVRTMQTFGEG